MKFVPLKERPDWKDKAEAAGFTFHTMHGAPYWKEDGAYAFSLAEVENNIEDPATELHAMCREAVARVVNDERLMDRFAIPENMRDYVATSWKDGEKELYGRFDFIYDGSGPAKMIEYNADTPTSLFEAGVWQWTWLQDMVERGALPTGSDQFNSIYDALVDRFQALFAKGTQIHFSSMGDATENAEDYGTVETMAFAARDAGMGAHWTDLSHIGITTEGQLADHESRVIETLFKLYPWEDMLRDDFATDLIRSGTTMLEPAWKAIVSNKALLPVMWEMFKGHPNLLPAFFEDDPKAGDLTSYVKKPIFSREGASVSIVENGKVLEEATNRDYDHNPSILQGYAPMKVWGNVRPLLGVWVVGETACGMGIREDESRITQDLSVFRPHFIE